MLGLDFLESNCCRVDLGANALYIGDRQIPLQRSRSPQPTCYRVITSVEVMVPAASEMVIPGKLATKPTNSIAWRVVESARTDLLVGRSLVDLQGEGVPVRMLNLSDQPKRSDSNEGATWLPALRWPACFNSHRCTRDGGKAPGGEMPDFVQDLYERSVVDLPLEQRSPRTECGCVLSRTR